MGTAYKKLSKDDAILLMIDHQSGLISLVQDFSPDDFKNSILALADIGKFFNLPTILTTSFDEGPNGPIVPELLDAFPDAPFIHRPGQINCWDNEDFKAAVEATGVPGPPASAASEGVAPRFANRRASSTGTNSAPPTSSSSSTPSPCSSCSGCGPSPATCATATASGSTPSTASCAR